MQPEKFMKLLPPDDMSEARKRIWSSMSPRAKTVFAMALDWDEHDFWHVLEMMSNQGYTDLISMGSKNMGLTPTRMVQMAEYFEEDHELELELDMGKASRFKAIMTEAMKAQDKGDIAFGEFLIKHKLEIKRIPPPGGQVAVNGARAIPTQPSAARFTLMLCPYPLPPPDCLCTGVIVQDHESATKLLRAAIGDDPVWWWEHSVGRHKNYYMKGFRNIGISCQAWHATKREKKRQREDGEGTAGSPQGLAGSGGESTAG